MSATCGLSQRFCFLRAGHSPSAPQKTQATVKVPLDSYAWSEDRGGTVARTTQIIERGAKNVRPGDLVISVVSDMEGPWDKGRADYHPLREELALDLGLATMLATPEGDFLGRAWRVQFEDHDRRLNALAPAPQKQGIRTTRRIATASGSPRSAAFSRPGLAGC